MQELVLVQPGRTVGDELEHEAAQADTRREFEARLAECGPLAYPVVRGGLRNTADAGEVPPRRRRRCRRSPRRISITPSRSCRKNCAWCFCLQPWKATR